MSEELMITQQDLIDWIDRPPSNNDLDLATFVATRLEKFYDLEHQLQQKENIIKEVREYITSYESIETIQQFDHNKNNKDLDYSTIDEMTRRYMMVHDKILKILDKEVNK